jgi:hypothetical protein
VRRGTESGGSFKKKMAELPKDEPMANSAFLFGDSERIFLLLIIRQERGESYG